MFELQLSDRGCVSRLLSPLGVTLNSVLVAEVNWRRRRRRGRERGHNDRSEYSPYPESAGLHRGSFLRKPHVSVPPRVHVCCSLRGAKGWGGCRSGLRKQLLFGLWQSLIQSFQTLDSTWGRFIEVPDQDPASGLCWVYVINKFAGSDCWRFDTKPGFISSLKIESWIKMTNTFIAYF